MDAQVITGVVVSTPYVNSGMPNNAGGGVADSGLASGIPAANVPMQADVVSINQAAGSSQGYQIGSDNSSNSAKEQKVTVNSKSATSENARSVVIKYNQLARASVVEFLDEGGNIVSQTPPRMYLKTMEASSSKLDASPGKLLNKVA